MVFVFSVLFGFCLSLGLLVLQAFRDLGLSPLGALCLFVMASNLVTILLSLRALNVAVAISGKLAGRIALASAGKVMGLGAFLAGQLLGSDYFFALMAIFYGLIAGTVWFRFGRMRSFSFVNRMGVVLGSVTVILFLVFDTRDLLRLGLPPPELWVARSLTLVGAIFLGIAQFVYSPSESGVARSVWNFWEGTFGVVLVLFVAGLVRAAAPENNFVAAGFVKQPLLILPFLLFGMVFGLLRERLFQAKDSRLPSGVVQYLWVSSASVGAIAAAGLVLPFSHHSVSLFGALGVVFALFLLRHDSTQLSDYTGIKQVDWISGQAGRSGVL